MVENPLFYKSIVPLNRAVHKDLGLESSETPYGFAQQTHIVPALVEEFGTAAAHLPIVFLPGPKHASPVFLVGLRPGRNEFVDGAGHWKAGYVPAYLRRYPFMFGEVEGRDPVICVDETFPGLLRDGGSRLFDDEGRDTPFLADKIAFVTRYFEAAKRSDSLIARLDELGLLRPISLETKSADGSSATMHGVFAVDENKLNSLSEAEFLRLRTDGLLGPIYAHLFSLASVSKLTPVPALVAQ